jgi:hypothetical protein
MPRAAPVTMAALPARRPVPGTDCAFVAGCVMTRFSVVDCHARREAAAPNVS